MLRTVVHFLKSTRWRGTLCFGLAVKLDDEKDGKLERGVLKPLIFNTPAQGGEYLYLDACIRRVAGAAGRINLSPTTVNEGTTMPRTASRSNVDRLRQRKEKLARKAQSLAETSGAEIFIVIKDVSGILSVFKTGSDASHFIQALPPSTVRLHLRIHERTLI